jgi:hypothetical protein
MWRVAGGRPVFGFSLVPLDEIFRPEKRRVYHVFCESSGPDSALRGSFVNGACVLSLDNRLAK